MGESATCKIFKQMVSLFHQSTFGNVWTTKLVLHEHPAKNTDLTQLVGHSTDPDP